MPAKEIRLLNDKLRAWGDRKGEGFHHALDYIVRHYTEEQALALCRDLARWLGVAEWIVRLDVKRKYRQLTELTSCCRGKKQKPYRN